MADGALLNEQALVRQEPFAEHAIFDLKGATQIVGAAAAQDVQIVTWITGFASLATLLTQVTAINAKKGQVSSLTYTGAAALTYTNTTLVSVERISFNRQNGALPNDPDTVGNWTDPSMGS